MKNVRFSRYALEFSMGDTNRNNSKKNIGNIEPKEHGNGIKVEVDSAVVCNTNAI